MSQPSIIFGHGIIPQQNEMRKELGTNQPPKEHQFGYTFCSFCPQFWKLKKELIIYTTHKPQQFSLTIYSSSLSPILPVSSLHSRICIYTELKTRSRVTLVFISNKVVVIFIDNYFNIGPLTSITHHVVFTCNLMGW